MIKIGIKEFPRAHRMATAICNLQNLSFPANVSALLEGINTHRIYDVSSQTYNAAFATKISQRIYPQKAWTVYNELLDTYLIIWNAARSSPSIRYSVAHEIGHILLDHQRSWPTDIALKKRQKEAEANIFPTVSWPLSTLFKHCTALYPIAHGLWPNTLGSLPAPPQKSNTTTNTGY